MRVTVDFLHKIMPIAPRNRLATFAPYIEATAIAYSITSKDRFCAWIANLAEESMELRYMEEIASGDAYDTRVDLGNTPQRDGDGRLYKGHGAIQLTGHTAHEDYTLYLKQKGHLPFVDFVKEPARLAELPYAIDSAGWFWSVWKNINVHADKKEFLACCIRVNGRNKHTGWPNGWNERKRYYERALSAFPDGDTIHLDADTPMPVAHYDPPPDPVTTENTYPDYVENPPQSVPEPQEVVRPTSGGENVSEGLETPNLGTSVLTYLGKEGPSLFQKVFTSLKIAIGTIIAGLGTYCGGTKMQSQLVSQTAENPDPNWLAKLVVVMIFILLCLVAGIVLVWLASYYWNKAADRSKDLNKAKISQDGLIELTDKKNLPLTTSPIEAPTVAVSATNVEVTQT